MNDDRPLYETHAMIPDGRPLPLRYIDWEYLYKEHENVVYLRKHLSGPINAESKGWLPVARQNC